MDAAALKDEIRKIVSSGNLNMSLSECRQLLEKNLELEPGTLLSRKAEIKEFISEVINEQAEEDSLEHGKAEEGSDSEQSPSEAEPVPKRKKSASKSSSGGGGFARPVPLSPTLSDFVGASEMARTKVTQFLWQYIKANHLQDPNDKRKIVCDEKLKKKHFPPSSASGSRRQEAEGSDESESQSDSDENSSAAKKRKRPSGGGGGGFGKPVGLSGPLSEFMGRVKASRSDVTKALWDHIKKKKLQDPRDGRQIRCDDALEALFGEKNLSSFQMNKLIQPHFVKIKGEENGDEAKTAKVESDGDGDNGEGSGGERQQKSKGKRRGGGLHSEMSLSEALSDVVGVAKLGRAQVVKRLWEYIKSNNLQDPSNKRNILCDDKMQKVMGTAKIDMFKMQKVLSKHMFPLDS